MSESKNNIKFVENLIYKYIVFGFEALYSRFADFCGWMILSILSLGIKLKINKIILKYMIPTNFLFLANLTI